MFKQLTEDPAAAKQNKAEEIKEEKKEAVKAKKNK